MTASQVTKPPPTDSLRLRGLTQGVGWANRGSGRAHLWPWWHDGAEHAGATALRPNPSLINLHSDQNSYSSAPRRQGTTSRSENATARHNDVLSADQGGRGGAAATRQPSKAVETKRRGASALGAHRVSIETLGYGGDRAETSCPRPGWRR